MGDETSRTVDGTDAAYREWLGEYAERRRERWEKRKRGLDADRRAERANLTLLELHRLAVSRLAKLSTVPASNPEPGRGGRENVGPPKQQALDDDWVWREHWRIIRHRLDRVHEKLDEAEGLGPVGVKTMIGAEKDQLIIAQGVGLSPEAVVDLLGHDIAGSPETVRRVRRAHGRKTGDGTIRDGTV